MAFDEDLTLVVQSLLGKTFGIQASAITLTSIVDAAIAFPLLAFAFYQFFGKIKPFRSTGKSNAVYAVIATSLVGMLVLQGGFLFIGGKLITFLAIPAAALFSEWEMGKKARFVFNGCVLVFLFYSLFGSLQLGINLVKPAVAALAVVNIFFSDFPLGARIFLIIVVLAFIFYFWSQMAALFSASGAAGFD